MVKDLTKGSPLRLILGFSVPIVLGNLVQQAYSWADTMMVGKLLGNPALNEIKLFCLVGKIEGYADTFEILLNYIVNVVIPDISRELHMILLGKGCRNTGPLYIVRKVGKPLVHFVMLG